MRARQLLIGLGSLATLAGCMRSDEPHGIRTDSLTYRDGSLVPTGLLSPTARLDSFDVYWYSQQLAALQEPRMTEAAPQRSSESYRFLWLRSFHHPVAIRVYSSPDGGVVVTSEGKGAGGYAPESLLRRDSAEITQQQWHALTTAIAEEALWTRGVIDTSRLGLDGATWTIEGRRGNRYVLVTRWAPMDTGATAFMRRLGLAFLRIARVDVPPQDLY